MSTSQATGLAVQSRTPSGSRGARRLRRAGRIPGVVYGGGQDPLAFEVDARELRLALAHAGAVLDLAIDGSTSPVVLKELIRHPVTGETTHVDLLRVRLDQPIHATVIVELVGGDEAPGVREGGVLEQVTREIEVQALPTDIPDGLQYDVSQLQINDTVTVDALQAPSGVTVLSDAEAVLAILSPPRLQVEEEPEIEEETELVAEGEAAEGEEADESASEETGGEGEGEGGE
jgi:large subunit ribosomal protein L25